MTNTIWLADGLADFALVNPSLQPGGDLPFQFRDGRSGTGALDAWYRAYAAREMKDVHYCFAVVQNPGTLHSRHPVLVPEDVKGMNIQSVTATVPLTVLLGGTNVQAPTANLRDLVERGKLDGVFEPWGAELLSETGKTLKYHIDVPFYASTYVWVMNKTRYDGLSPAQKRVIDDHCTTDWAIRFAKRVGGRRKRRPRETDRAARASRRDADAGATRRVEEGDRAALRQLVDRPQYRRNRSGRSLSGPRKQHGDLPRRLLETPREIRRRTDLQAVRRRPEPPSVHSFSPYRVPAARPVRRPR
ncbi:MAG: hypothetical protein WDN69_08790 [Aliidongia sp.]